MNLNPDSKEQASGAHPAEERTPTPKKRKPNTTLPRTSAPKAAPAAEAPVPEKPKTAPPKTAKRPSRRVHTAPVPSPQDEALDEALDEFGDAEPATVEEPEELPEETAELPGGNTIFQRMKHRRERQAEQKLSTLELIRKKVGLSEDDVALMLELGYEAELGRLVGYENLKKLKYDHLRRTEDRSTHRYRTAFGYCGTEAVGAQGKQRILAAYHADRRFLLLRTLLTALCTVFLFLLELPALFGERFLSLYHQYELPATLLSLFLLVAVGLLAHRHILAGLRSLLRFHPTPYSVPAVILPFSLGYGLLTLFKSDALSFRTGFLTALLFLLPAMYDTLRLSTELRAYRIFTADGTKHVLEPVSPRKIKLRQGGKLVKVINDDIDESFYRLNRAEQLTGFFRRFNSMGSATLPFQLFTCLTLTLSFFAGFFVWVTSDSPSAAFTVWMQILLGCAPVAAVFVYFVPLCRANRILTHYNCALLGEAAVEEYRASKTLIFPDTDLFSVENRAQITPQAGADLRRDMKLANLLFAKLGGTLEPDIAVTGTGTPVSLVRVADNGVEAVIDNRYHVLAGSADFLKRHGIRMPRESSDQQLARTPDTACLHVAVDGTLRLTYELRYAEKADFLPIMEALAEIDAAVAIRTYDPNLNKVFLDACHPDSLPPVRVIKPGRFEGDPIPELVDAGAVALGDRMDLLSSLYAAHGITCTRRFGYIWQLVISLVSGLGIMLAGFLGQSAHIGILSIAALWMLSLLIPGIVSAHHLNRHTLKLRKNRKK